MDSLVSLTGSDVSVVTQLTPIMLKMTDTADEISDELEVCKHCDRTCLYLSKEPHKLAALTRATTQATLYMRLTTVHFFCIRLALILNQNTQGSIKSI